MSSSELAKRYSNTLDKDASKLKVTPEIIPANYVRKAKRKLNFIPRLMAVKTLSISVGCPVDAFLKFSYEKRRDGLVPGKIYRWI